MISPFGSPETTYLGTVFVVLGYLLAVHGWTFLIAGFDGSEIPAAVVTDTVGRFALLVGVATIGFGAVARRHSHSLGRQGLLFGAVVLLATVGLTYRLNTYESAETTDDGATVDLSTSPVEPDTEPAVDLVTAPPVQRPVTKSAGDPVDNAVRPRTGVSSPTTAAPAPSSSSPTTTTAAETPAEQPSEEPSRNSVETFPEASD